MDSVEMFLAHAVKLEQEAAERFGQLADAMTSAGNRDVGALFRRLSDYSRLHLSDAKARAGFRDLPKLAASEFVWPDLESPEVAAIWAADPQLGREDALRIALDAERAGLEYYRRVYHETREPEIKALAKEFSEEEEAHVAELEKWLAARSVNSIG